MEGSSRNPRPACMLADEVPRVHRWLLEKKKRNRHENREEISSRIPTPRACSPMKYREFTAGY